MAKRFTDTEKWKKQWIKELSPEMKLVWIYLTDNCNHAGIWDVEIDVMNIRLGLNLTETGILKCFKDKIISIDNGRKWYLSTFIDFQYGELNLANRVHASVQNELNRYKLKPLTKGFISPLQGAKDKDKDKDKEKDKEIIKAQEHWFNELWAMYPKKFGKKEAWQHFRASVKTEEKFFLCKKALSNYIDLIKTEAVEHKYIKHGKTWFNNWEDSLDIKVEKSELDKFKELL